MNTSKSLANKTFFKPNESAGFNILVDEAWKKQYDEAKELSDQLHKIVEEINIVKEVGFIHEIHRTKNI